MPVQLRNPVLRTVLVAAGWMLLTASASNGQQPGPAPVQATQPAAEPADSGPTIGESRVGYIDGAIPGNQLRLRFDSAYNSRRPTRAEFFYPRSAPLGPGLPMPESSVDYQEFTAHLEAAVCERFSGFVELPTRFLNPDLNANSAGLSDLNAGFKYAFIYSDDLVATFQYRTYAPTGDADRGLGNDHVSLEPALLVYKQLDERLSWEGELHYWIPIGGTAFAGDIIRYGVGLHYDLFQTCNLQVTPVAELVGWTVLDGLASVRQPSGVVGIEDVTGDTILNAKLGVRVQVGDRSDIYLGYGRPLTGDRWYENLYRVEFRLLF